MRKRDYILKRLFYSLAFLCIILAGWSKAFAQDNRIHYNNQELFLNGANLAWLSFANDIGSGTNDYDAFAETLLSIHSHGGNAVRWWLHINGTVTPEFDSLNFVIGPGAGTIKDLQRALDLAWEREVGLVFCLWSFDMLSSSNSAAVINRNRLLLNDTTYTRAYINNCLIPMVDSLKGHPAIISWEIFNEPEGMSNEFGWSAVQHVPMSSIQRFVNLCTGAIHRTDTTALVTNGSWSFKALTDVTTAPLAKTDSEISQLSFFEKQQITTWFNQTYRSSLQTAAIMDYLQRVAEAANYNYYSDSRLIGVGGDPDGTLDFYSVHYYSGIVPRNPTSISPFHHPKSYWGLDKPIVVAEFSLQNSSGILKAALYDTLFKQGYAGALAWSWTDFNFSSHEDMLASMQFMWNHYRADVDVNGISGDWPEISIVSPVSETLFPDSAEVTIETTASDNDGQVVLVEFFANDTLKIGERNAEPFSITWTDIAPNIYRLTAIATDNQGHKSKSKMVEIQVGTLPIVRLEAEYATREGTGISVVTGDDVASNGAYVNIATNDTTVTITWQLNNVPAAGNYEIAFGYRLYYDSPKTQFINVNGVRVAMLEFTAASMTKWYEKKLSVNLVQGNNTIQMQMAWGWMYLDYLAVPSSIIQAVDGTPDVPLSCSLRQNYPNPFNPVTTISYTLAKPAPVRLAVYDLLGRQIHVLVDKRQNAGVYKISFDGRNLASGVYFYRLTAGSFIDIKRMLLLK